MARNARTLRTTRHIDSNRDDSPAARPCGLTKAAGDIGLECRECRDSTPLAALTEDRPGHWAGDDVGESISRLELKSGSENCCGPRAEETTISRATASAVFGPQSSSIIASARSMPALTPADV